MEDLDVNISTACRLCLASIEDEFISIDEDLFQSIETIVGFNMLADEQPMNLCKSCHSIMEFIQKFRRMCENTETYLREFYYKMSHDQILQRTDEQSTEISIPAEGTQEAYFQQEDLTVVEKHEEVGEDQQIEVGEQGAEFLFEYDDEIADSQVQQMTKTINNIDTEYANDENIEEEELWVEETCEVNREDDGNFYVVEDIADGESERITNSPPRTLGVKGGINAKLGKEYPVVHVCGICGNRYKRLGALETHQRRHQNERPFECEICSAKFGFNFQLERHMRKHTGDRPYICEFCNRKFMDRSTMSRHQKIHRNERAYTCNTCGKSFTYYSVLKTHIMSHTGERPYCCGICDKRFPRASDLRNHLETLQHRRDPRTADLIKDIRREDEW